MPGPSVAKAVFSKLATTPEQLLLKLTGRGLVVPPATHTQALAYLRYVGGYRLKGYWFHAVDPNTKRFPAGYTFDHLVQRCEFDRELRAATIAAIAYLSMKSRTVYKLGEALTVFRSRLDKATQKAPHLRRIGLVPSPKPLSKHPCFPDYRRTANSYRGLQTMAACCRPKCGPPAGIAMGRPGCPA